MRKYVPFLITVAFTSTACRNDCAWWWDHHHRCSIEETTTDLVGTDADTDTDWRETGIDMTETDGVDGHSGLTTTDEHSGVVIDHSGAIVDTGSDDHTSTVHDTGSVVDTDPTGDTGSAVVETGGSPEHTGAINDTGTGSQDTGLVTETGDTGVPCMPVAWYPDADGDHVCGTEAAVVQCDSPGTSWCSAPGTDCDDGDADNFPGNGEVCDGQDNNCNGSTDEGLSLTLFLDADADGYGDPTSTRRFLCSDNTAGYVDDNTDCDDNDAAVHDTCCAAGESRFSGSYTSPGGAAITAVKIQIYDQSGAELRNMIPILDGVDDWTVDTSVQGVVTFSNGACWPDANTFYASALYNGFPGYDCDGLANPTYTPYGTWEFSFDGAVGSVEYVNNYEVNGSFPFGYGNGCEAKALR